MSFSMELLIIFADNSIRSAARANRFGANPAFISRKSASPETDV
ncbi:MAG: hypothetical protein PSN37_02275 [Alphaproteobacteria bacterium]|nr:hypothetical protein [Alphaproteobacteria bacterium]